MLKLSPGLTSSERSMPRTAHEGRLDHPVRNEAKHYAKSRIWWKMASKYSVNVFTAHSTTSLLPGIRIESSKRIAPIY